MTSFIARRRYGRSWSRRLGRSGKRLRFESLESRRLLAVGLTFQSPESLVTGRDTAWITIADLNHDNFPDLIAADRQMSGVTVLLGQESGAFAVPMSYSTGRSTTFVTTADMDSDGDLDLLASGQDTANVDVFYNRGVAGEAWLGLDRPVDLATQGRPTAVVTADFDTDGHIDLAVADEADVSVRLARGDRSFAEPVHYLPGSGNRALAAGDFDGDAYLDLVVASSESADVAMLLGNGDGTFEPHDKTYSLGESGQAGAITTGDFDQDGDLDLAVGQNFDYSPSGGNISIFLGHGDGSFAPEPARYPVSGRTSAIVGGDLDEDGDLDLAVSARGVPEGPPGGLFVLLAEGDGSFGAAIQLAEYESHFANAPNVELVDLNGDGRLDLLSGQLDLQSGTVRSVAILLGTRDATFETDWSTYAAGADSTWVATGDVNGDTDVDLVLTNAAAGDVSVLLGGESTSFSQPVSQQRHRVGASPNAQITTDLNSDGNLDLAVVNRGSNDISILLGRGNGAFGRERRYAVGESPNSITAADLDADGDLDLAVTNEAARSVSVLRGAGDGSFADEQRFATPAQPNSVAATDADQDGKLDLVVSAGNSVSVLLARGDSTFGFEQENRYTAGLTPNAQIAADFNGDGNLDLAVSGGTDSVSVLLANGDGSLAEPIRVAARGWIDSVAALDADGDGNLDLLLGGERVQILRGDGTGAFLRADSIGGYQAIGGDFNGDGNVDLAITTDTEVVLRLGNGDATFRDRVVASTTRLIQLRTADFDGNGLTDLLGVRDPGGLAVLLNESDGTFARARSVSGARNPNAYAIGDWDGDGDSDLAIARSTSTAEIALYLSDGDGTFTRGDTHDMPNTANSITSGDWDGDGDLDLAAAIEGDMVRLLLAADDGTFKPGAAYSVGEGTAAVTAGDLDGDGDLDLSVINRNSGDLSLLLSNGDGTFRAPNRLAAGQYPSSVQPADFNSDRKVDLVVANRNSSTVSVLLGTEYGEFAAPVAHEVGGSTYSVAVTDLNGDGKTDLVVTSQSPGQVLIMMGNGDGTFANPTSYEVVGGANAVAAMDVDDNGTVDLAVSSTSRGLLLLGNGDGTFAPAHRLVLGSGANSVVSGDFDHDGDVDLAVANQSTNDVSVLVAHGDGSFDQEPLYEVGDAPNGATLADLNRDGKLDLAVTNAGSSDVSVLLGNGNGTFDAERRYDAGGQPSSFAAADWNGDAALDLAIANFDSGKVSMLLGNGDGTFRDHNEDRYGVGNAPFAQIAADINRDSHVDLLVANAESADVSVLLGQRDRTFRPEARVHVQGRPASLAVGDLDGDGALELVVAGESVGDGSLSVQILDGNADGSFGSSTLYPIAGQGRINSITAADVDEDGILDLAAVVEPNDPVIATRVQLLRGVGAGKLETGASYRVGRLAYSLIATDLSGDGHLDLAVSTIGGVDVLLAAGDGTFSARRTSAIARPNLSSVGVLRDADLDADGDQDLVVAAGERISILLSNGDGTFAEARADSVKGAVNSLAADDLNGDGRVDLAIAAGSDQLWVLLGNGNGAFPRRDTRYNYTVGNGISSLIASDLDGDGDVDLALANRNSNEVSILPGHGDGTFVELPRFEVGDSPTSAVADDLDRDGNLDLIVANRWSGLVSVLPGNGDGTFGLRRSFWVGDDPAAVTPADLDADGDLDLAVAHHGPKKLSVLLGKGDGSFTRIDQYTVGASPTSVIAADVNGDGILDVLSGNSVFFNVDSGGASLLLGRGDGTFQPAVNYYFASHSIRSLAAVDLDGDGDRDLVLLSAHGADVLRNNTPRDVASRAGDANHDGEFNQLDIVLVLQSAQYLTGLDATFEQGDWNHDGVFDQRDIVAALQTGDYLQGR